MTVDGVYEADPAHLGADLDGAATTALYLEILGDGHGVPAGENVANGVPDRWQRILTRAPSASSTASAAHS